MKKLILSILAILLCLSAFTLIACNGDDSTTTDNGTTIPSVEYNITYELNGGTNNAENPIGYNSEDIITLNTPTREGYFFAGWYTDPEFENIILEINEDTSGDLTLYAKWLDSDDYIQFELYEDFYKVIGCDQSVEYLFIPSTYNGLPVKTVARQAFKYYKNLRYVYIPDSVTTIGAEAFFHCEALAKVRMPKNVKNIYTLAFSGCKSLTSLTLPNGLEIISSAVFSSSGLTSINIPDSVTTIEYQAFSSCENLTEINLSKELTTIEFHAFLECKSLENIVIPSKVTTIGFDAFIDCLSLKNIDVESENEFFKSVDGVLYSKDGKTLVCYPSAKTEESYTIKDGTEIIESKAFYGNACLEGIVIPNSVITIEYGAFLDCKKLKSIVLSNSLESMGNSAFRNCTAVESITIPGSLKEIKYEAFSGCSSLKTVIIEEGVTSMGTFAFYGCSSLESVKLPHSLEFIDYDVFGKCVSLKSIVIPKNVAVIKGNVFWRVPDITVYCEAESKPDGWNEYWSRDAKEVIWGYDGE